MRDDVVQLVRDAGALAHRRLAAVGLMIGFGVLISAGSSTTAGPGGGDNDVAMDTLGGV